MGLSMQAVPFRALAWRVSELMPPEVMGLSAPCPARWRLRLERNGLSAHCTARLRLGHIATPALLGWRCIT